MREFPRLPARLTAQRSVCALLQPLSFDSFLQVNSDLVGALVDLLSSTPMPDERLVTTVLVNTPWAATMVRGNRRSGLCAVSSRCRFARCGACLCSNWPSKLTSAAGYVLVSLRSICQIALAASNGISLRPRARQGPSCFLLAYVRPLPVCALRMIE